MTVVIADTSPLNYLVLIDEIEVLPKLYGRILIPSAVFTELADPGAPLAVRAWVSSKPSWIEIRDSRHLSADPALDELDGGERAAIVLAMSEKDALLVIDEAAGRLEAT